MATAPPTHDMSRPRPRVAVSAGTNRVFECFFGGSDGGTTVAQGRRVLRISRIQENGAGVCLKVEGRLSGDGVALLEGELAAAAAGPAGVPTLDLAAVDFASLQAAEMLLAATRRGVRVVACSPFLARLLVTP